MTSNTQKSALNIVMGAMTFGEAGKDGARVHNIKDVEAILDAFRSHGHTEIDTARGYCSGTSEEYLGKIDLAAKGLKLETKLYPVKGGAEPIAHDEAGLRKHLAVSLEALNVKSLEMWYLHGPDRTVPYEETLRVVNDLYKEGYFKRFGISNYTAWEVAEIVGICKANGYIQPSAYQGIYNAIHRAVEPELLPCLRKFGISFYEFNPFIVSKWQEDSSQDATPRQATTQRKGRDSIQIGHKGRYWKEPYFKAIGAIKEVADKNGLTLTEIALRWISHHSLLKREYGDAVLIGASSLKHIQENLVDLEKGPLPEEVLKVLDEAWFDVQPYASKYYH
ncbi:Aldo-keto reductase [Psilocybe cubensis]|uniref:Aldo-keto reductase n=1 Tax=Psilocybe cubensis TaxID=181762 RepID=A0ACB8H7B4_PSICU|nr:Aldo-keto reductase [Psilocybe cubensis]KAH9483766.1 Aldo-keto reductase [Psilocybe cubensis]